MGSYITSIFLITASITCGCGNETYRVAGEHGDDIAQLDKYFIYDREPVDQRIAAISQKFVTEIASYDSSGPLGEGAGSYDSDPLIRFDRFDCVTFVETVMALSISRASQFVLPTLNAIRYRKGVATFVQRNHFPDADWIPENSATGSVVDITTEIAHNMGFEAKIAEARVDRAAWYRKVYPAQFDAFASSGIPFESDVSLPYISLLDIFSIPKGEHDRYLEQYGILQAKIAVETDNARLQALREQSNALGVAFRGHYHIANSTVLAKIPNGAVLNTVRPNWDLVIAIGTHMNVSHQGFAIWKDGELYYRCASSTVGRIVDIPFVDELSGYITSPTIRGFNILAVKEPDIGANSNTLQ